MSARSELENMVRKFRVCDLRILLGFAGCKKSGLKCEMQKRALELNLNDPNIESKIREIHDNMYPKPTAGIVPLTPVNQNVVNVPSSGGSATNPLPVVNPPTVNRNIINAPRNPPSVNQTVVNAPSSSGGGSATNPLPVVNPPTVNQNIVNAPRNPPQMNQIVVNAPSRGRGSATNLLPVVNPTTVNQNIVNAPKNPPPMNKNVVNAPRSGSSAVNPFVAGNLSPMNHGIVLNAPRSGSNATNPFATGNPPLPAFFRAAAAFSTSLSSMFQTVAGSSQRAPAYVPQSSTEHYSSLEVGPLSNSRFQGAVKQSTTGFSQLPFYDTLRELLPPFHISPTPEESFMVKKQIFYLRYSEKRQLEMNKDLQIQLRVCLILETGRDQDRIPTSISVNVNNKVVELPLLISTYKSGKHSHYPSHPVNITQLCHPGHYDLNTINISAYGGKYVVAVYLVQKQNSAVLIQRLKSKDPWYPNHTVAMIKEKLSQERDSEIATTSLRGSLLCPLGKIKMQLPCRALTCTHLQCFEATLYVQMNEKKQKWMCPICDKPAPFDSLVLDGLFLNIIKNSSKNCTEVQFHKDGSWTPIMQVQASEVFNLKNNAAASSPTMSNIEVIDLDCTLENSWCRFN